jgi:hypothetical protein
LLDAVFVEAFSGTARFGEATFSRTAVFEKATFEKKPVFGGVLVADPMLTHTWPTDWAIQTEHGTTTLVEAPGTPN